MMKTLPSRAIASAPPKDRATDPRSGGIRTTHVHAYWLAAPLRTEFNTNGRHHYYPSPSGKRSPLADSESTPIKISIVEDDDWIRENLAGQIDLAPGYRCISRYRTGEEALLGLPSDMPDVVLMDINLPGLSGIECVRRVKTLLPSLNILMLTVYEESDQIFDSLRAGASGYLLKRSAETELLDAIAQVHQGGSPMSSLVARKVVQFFNHINEAAPELQRLSPREKEILELLSRGAAYKEIGNRLSLSIHTVRMHIRGIYGKLQVHSRGEAVAKYLRP